MDDLQLAARALDVNEANLSLGHEVFEASGARFVRDPRVPDIRDANHVSNITAASPAQIADLFARVEVEYAGIPHRAFFTDHRTPPQFEARLRLDGYEHNEALVFVLEGALGGAPPAVEITRVHGDGDWAALNELRKVDWAESRARLGQPEQPGVGERMASTGPWKQPPVQFWLAHADGVPRGYFSSWEGIDGVGQVEDLFVHPDWRNRGIASALIRHCVAECRAKGAGPVVIVADPTDTPKNIYASMGWRPIAVARHYWREAG